MHNELDSRPYVCAIHAENNNTARDIEQSHKRYEDGTHTGYGLNAAQDDASCQDADEDTHNPRRYAKGLAGQQGNRVCLNGTAYAKRCQSGEDCKQDGEPLHAQTTLQGIHRTTISMPFLIVNTIFDSQQTLGILRCHTEDTRQPTPKHSTRTTQGYSCSHTHNVTRSDGGCQSRCQSTKLADIACCTRVLLDRQTDTCKELTLRDAQTDGQEHVRT